MAPIRSGIDDISVTANKSIQVLVIEDDTDDVVLLKKVLARSNAKGIVLTHVVRLGDALERIAASEFDVILMDLELADCVGLSGIARINHAAPDIPIIVLTGLDDDALAVKALQEGAQDYLAKGELVSSTLLRAIRYAIERKRSEGLLRQSERQLKLANALHESEERFRLMIEGVKDYAIFMLDAEGQVATWNVGAERITGYSENDIVGQHFDIFHTQEDIAAGKPQAQLRNAEENESYEEEGWRIRKDGSRFFAKVTLTSNRDHRGVVRGFSVVNRDVTDIAEAQRLLVEAKENAESANRAKRNFLANMSHEIRTPMTSILGYADLLSSGRVPPDQMPEFFQTIRRSGRHLLSILNDILDISKIEAGKMHVEQIACSPAEILAEVEALLSPRASSKNLTFTVECRAQVPNKIYSDPTRIRQILFNLASNAIKFTAEGGVRIIADAEPDGILRFDIIDTGIGLTQEQQAGLFKPYIQAEQSTVRCFGGTGLGLAVSNFLVGMLGGRMSVTSAPGSGSTFTFTVRDNSTDRIDEAPERPEARQFVIGSHTLQGRRILLAEDAADNRRLITLYLETEGAIVDPAENGRVAVDRTIAAQKANEPYDAVLMDMDMPVLNGRDATAEIRKAGLTDLPVIALTANAMDGERERCTAAGCDDYATKPLNPSELISTIARHVGRSSNDPQAPVPPGSSQSAPSTGEARSETGKIRSLLSDDPRFREILPRYVADLPAQILHMENLLSQSNLPELRRQAHQLKGSGGGYGFPEMTTLATTVENAIDSDQSRQQIAEDVKKLIEYIRRLEGFDDALERAA